MNDAMMMSAWVLGAGPKGSGAPPWVPIALMGVLAVVILGSITLARRYDRKRREGVRAMLEGRGMVVREGGQAATRTPLGEALGPIAELAKRTGGTVWAAEGEEGGVELMAVEHHYTTGSGKHRQTHNHSVVSLPAPTGWPTLEVYAEHFFHKIGELFGARDIKVEDDAFNGRFRVKGDSEDFAVLFLSPEVQRMMLGWDRSLRVAVKAGRLCVYRSGHLKAEGWPPLLEAALALRAALPPELDEWTA